jgi:hypothetical protein
VMEEGAGVMGVMVAAAVVAKAVATEAMVAGGVMEEALAWVKEMAAAVVVVRVRVGVVVEVLLTALPLVPWTPPGGPCCAQPFPAARAPPVRTQRSPPPGAWRDTWRRPPKVAQQKKLTKRYILYCFEFWVGKETLLHG